MAKKELHCECLQCRLRAWLHALLLLRLDHFAGLQHVPLQLLHPLCGSQLVLALVCHNRYDEVGHRGPCSRQYLLLESQSKAAGVHVTVPGQQQHLT